MSQQHIYREAARELYRLNLHLFVHYVKYKILVQGTKLAIIVYIFFQILNRLLKIMYSIVQSIYTNAMSKRVVLKVPILYKS